MSAMVPSAADPFTLDDAAGTRKFTVKEYRRLIDADILRPEDRVELLDGYVVYKQDHVTLPPADGPFPQWRGLRRWTAAEYRQMIDLGVIGEDEKLELLDGYLVLKMPQSTAHRATVARLSTRLPVRLPAGWVVITHCPISVAGSDPEPDGVVLRGIDADYDHRVPTVQDFGIVIEVSASTLALDRSAKGRLYSRVRLPVYWVVNLVDRQIEVYADPDPAATPPAYRTRTDYRPGDAVPVVLDGQPAGSIPVSELIP